MTKPKPIPVTSEPVAVEQERSNFDMSKLLAAVHSQRDQITVLNTRLFQLEERIAALERIAAPIVESKAREVLKDEHSGRPS
jgi:hypothetical protein